MQVSFGTIASGYLSFSTMIFLMTPVLNIIFTRTIQTLTPVVIVSLVSLITSSWQLIQKITYNLLLARANKLLNFNAFKMKLLSMNQLKDAYLPLISRADISLLEKYLLAWSGKTILNKSIGLLLTKVVHCVVLNSFDPWIYLTHL